MDILNLKSLTPEQLKQKEKEKSDWYKKIYHNDCTFLDSLFDHVFMYLFNKKKAHIEFNYRHYQSYDSMFAYLKSKIAPYLRYYTNNNKLNDLMIDYCSNFVIWATIDSKSNATIEHKAIAKKAKESYNSIRKTPPWILWKD